MVSFITKKSERRKNMNIQNETIRINIDIDDRAIRNLNDIISDLNDTISTLNSSVGNIQSALNNLSSSSGPVESSSNSFGVLALAMLALNADSGKLAYNISSLSSGIFPTLSAETGKAETGIGKLLGAFGKTAQKVGPAGVALGGFKLALGGLGFGLVIGGARLFTGWLSNMVAEASRTTRGIRALSIATRENRQTYEERRNELQNEIQTNNDLITRLRELQRQESMTNVERVESIGITRELNGRIDGLNMTYDTTTGLLDENGAATLALADRYAVLETATDTLSLNQERLNEITGEYDVRTEMLEELRSQLEETDETIFNHSRNLEETNHRYTELQIQIRVLEEGQRSLREETRELEFETNVTASSMTQAWETLAFKSSLSMETMTESQRLAVEGFQSMYEIGASRLGDLTRAFEENAELTWESVQYNQDRIIEATAEHTDLYKQLVEAGFSEAYLQAIGADSVEALPLLRGMMDDGIDTVRAREQEWLAAHENNANTILDGFDFSSVHQATIREYMLGGVRDTFLDTIDQANFPDIGQAIPDGVIQGARNGHPQAIEELERLARDLGLCFTDILGIQSPSRVFTGYGENIVEGLIQGLEALKSQPTTRMQQLATSMQRIYNTANRDYTAIGRGIMTGLNQGLLNNENTVMNTARRLANNIARTMREALDINSPSRLMREQVGRQIPAGVAAGIDKYADYALDSMSDLGKELIKVNIPNINDMISMGPSLNIASGTNSNGGNITYDNSSHYDRMFEGATIQWSGEQDIRQTMKEIAWTIYKEEGVL